MINREHETLLHEVLSGKASPEDTARLEAWLQSNPEGQQRRRELEALFAALAAVPMVPAPPALRENVLGAIRARSRSAASRTQASPRRAWFLVPVAAAAIAVAFAFPWARQALRPDSMPDVSGSLAERSPSAPARKVLTLPGTTVSLSTVTAEGGTLVSVTAETGIPTGIEFEAPQAVISRASVTGLSPGAAQLDAANGRLTLALDGPARFAISFHPALRRGESVKVVVRAGERRAEGVLPQPMEGR